MTNSRNSTEQKIQRGRALDKVIARNNEYYVDDSDLLKKFLETSPGTGDESEYVFFTKAHRLRVSENFLFIGSLLELIYLLDNREQMEFLIQRNSLFKSSISDQRKKTLIDIWKQQRLYYDTRSFRESKFYKQTSSQLSMDDNLLKRIWDERRISQPSSSKEKNMSIPRTWPPVSTTIYTVVPPRATPITSSTNSALSIFSAGATSSSSAVSTTSQAAATSSFSTVLTSFMRNQ